ncbi:MAG: YajQ family cyclic di-GMP-binding protein [Gammaproteobacteria bacterium]|nr:YajQ family cyclic di-GMP-binding protein [Gammaproteobacteria bacterium]MDH5659874.1 YajQ family cyclic di-GMP-binding protein [Gammaproteobacteria bacterium]
MPSFDVVSEVDFHEVTNAVDQANRELSTRFDFRGVTATFERANDVITMTADADIQLQQMLDILQNKLHRRDIDIACLEVADAIKLGKQVKQKVTIRQGLDKDLSRKVVKLIKEKKLKVQAAIQGDKVRVTGKKRDDLQQTIAVLKAADLEMPLQYDNFRD